MAGAEALARWTHPELGPIAPEVFVAVPGLRIVAGVARLGRGLGQAGGSASYWR